MALEKKGSGTIYLTVTNGAFVRQVMEATSESVTRVNKIGRTVHEVFYRKLTATLTSIEVNENDYGKLLSIKCKDDGSAYVINMPYSSRYSTSILKAIPNIVISQPVAMLAWQLNDKNDPTKKISGITCYQENDAGMEVKILPYYTKDEPKGLPQMKKIKVKGKDVWDDTEMMDFLVKEAVLVFSNESEEEAPF